MTTDHKHLLAAVAIAALAYFAGKREALKKAATPAANANIAGAAEWWSYAGTWGM